MVNILRELLKQIKYYTYVTTFNFNYVTIENF